ncbi:Ribonuclease H-like domain containing protein [Elaphomyces granulatus]
MAGILSGMLQAGFDTEILPQGNTRPVMRYQGEASFVRCLAHILNLIVKEFLATLKASNTATDSLIVEDLQNNISLAESHSPFSRLGLEKEWRDLCQIKGMNSKLIQYDVDTRWNSAYRMLDDAWNAAPQIQEYLKITRILPPFTTMDWNHLGQIRTILAEFDKYTLELSTDIPQISQSLVIYYRLFDLLQEVQDREGRFVDFNMDIANAAKGAMKKYDKYYTLMDDSCDILYITMLLDPRFKKLVLEHELKDGAENIVAAMQQQLEIQYPIARHEPVPPPTSESGSAISHKTIVSEIMNKIKAKSQKSPDKSSDIARYLNSDVVEFDEKKKDWIFSWWGGRRHRELIAVTLREWFLGSGVFALAMHGKPAAQHKQ